MSRTSPITRFPSTVLIVVGDPALLVKFRARWQRVLDKKSFLGVTL
jgi:hypothetical protein